MWYLEDIRVTYTCRYDFLYANMFLIQTMAVRNFDFQTIHTELVRFIVSKS